MTENYTIENSQKISQVILNEIELSGASVDPNDITIIKIEGDSFSAVYPMYGPGRVNEHESEIEAVRTLLRKIKE